MNKYHISFALILLILIAQGQTLAQRRVKKSPPSFPIVFGKKSDGFPETLEVRGIVTEVNPNASGCGRIRTSGTIKVKLISKIEGYNHEYVYLVLPCFSGIYAKGTYLNKQIHAIYVSKMYDLGTPCFLGRRWNTIDSPGIPFYYWREWRSSEGGFIEDDR